MALYKFRGFFIQTNRPAFDELHEPGATVLHQGIYRCRQCGTEIVLAAGQTLPPENHHQHIPSQGKIRWQLIVAPSYAG
jgi:hypothetical protein